MTGGNPWMKFYPADWRAEPRLRLISRAARSLWLDMLGLMFEAGTGRLEVDGRPMTERELAAMLGDNPRTVRKLLEEIEAAGVSSRDQEGFVCSRRIIRDLLRAEKDRLNGRMGGNPALKNKHLPKKGVNPEDKAQKPEARSQIENPPTGDSHFAGQKPDETTPDPPDDKVTVEDVVEGWNDLAAKCDLPAIVKLSEARRRQLKARLREYPDIDQWKRAFSAIHGSAFLRGDNNRGWRANFDFLLQPSSFLKLLEGAYDQTHQ